MSDNVVHRTATQSFWNGWIRALCGAEAQAGEYESSWLFPLRGPRCQSCERIHESGGE